LVAITWSLVPKDGQEVLENYTPKEGENTITTIIKLLRKVLTIQDSQQAAQEALKGIKKKREESERTFANRVETLIKKAFLSLNEKERDQMTTNCFVAGHNLPMQELLFAKNAKGFADTLEEAVRQEAWIVKKLVLEEEAMNLRQLREGAQEKMPMKKDEEMLETEPQESYTEIQQLQPPRTGEITCFNCGRRGHMANVCRAPKKEIGNNYRGSKNFQDKTKEKNTSLCSYCGKTGHWEISCWRRQAAENRENSNTQQQPENHNQGQIKEYQREPRGNRQIENSTNQKQHHTLESIGEELRKLSWEYTQIRQKEQQRNKFDYDSKNYLRDYVEKHGPPPPPRLAIQDFSYETSGKNEHEENSGN
jgi:hypothetical protein